MHLAEQRGIGLRSMKHLPEEGFPLPSFKLKAGILEITFGRTKDYVAEKAGLLDITKLTEEDKAGLLFIQQKGEISRSEFVAEFGMNEKKAQRRLAKLVEINLIEMIGNKRGARYKAKKCPLCTIDQAGQAIKDILSLKRSLNIPFEKL